MKTRTERLKVSALTIAVQSALAAMCVAPLAASADAIEDEVAAIRRPTNYVELGVEHVNRDSAKFGEYNGLNNSGAAVIGNFSVRGGDAYEGGNGITRWGVSGRDLGTTSRELGASVDKQGQWGVSINYDELRHNISDTYRTPLQGNMGGNNFTLPSNFGSINGAAAPSARSLNATQLGAFHQEDVGTTRKNTSFAANFSFSPQLTLKFDYNNLEQTGAKLIGTGNQGMGATYLIGGVQNRAEAVSILMSPTKYKTDTVNLTLNWTGEKGYLSGGYFGSFFRDGYDSVSWQNNMTNGNGAACVGSACFTNNTMSTAPNNNFHQLNLSGGYSFSSATKLVGGLSYGRNTQDASYASTSIAQPNGFVYNMMQANGLPQSSLNGSVVTRHVDLKLTNKTTKDLTLSAAYKFNERDNRTGSSTYLYKDIGNGNYTGVNTPYSHKKSQFELAADYRLTKDQSLRAVYERENIDRRCNDVVGGRQCVASPSSDEDKLGLTYRLKASNDVKLNAGLAYANRKAKFDHAYAADTGTYPAVNGGDVVGFVAYPYASRKQGILKAGVNWQATDKLDIGLNGRYSKDKYDATLGVQDGHTGTINLDATYSFTETSSISAYASLQSSTRKMQNAGNGSATVVPTQIWTNDLDGDSQTFGINARHTGMMGGKLELLGDVSYSYDKSHYSTQVPYNAACSATTSLICGDTPDISAKLLTVKATGIYALDKSSKIALAYLYQKLKSNDYYYNGYEYGYTPNRVMPTFEQAPNYSVNVISASYIYSFK